MHEVEYPQAVLAGAASGLIEGVGRPESVVNHFVLLLKHIVSQLYDGVIDLTLITLFVALQRSRKQGLDLDENSGPNPFDDIDVTGPCLK